jgi:hypothetical protein
VPQRSLRVPPYASPAQQLDPSHSPSECTARCPSRLSCLQPLKQARRSPRTLRGGRAQVVHRRQVDARPVRQHAARSQSRRGSVTRRPRCGARDGRDHHTRRRRRRCKDHASSAHQHAPRLCGGGRPRRPSRLRGGGVPSSARRCASSSCLASCHGAPRPTQMSPHGVSLAERAAEHA